MADKKISALPAATTPLAGTEVLPIVQSGTTDQVSVANLTAGRAVSASSFTASSLTANRVTYAGTSGLLQDSANYTFNGTTARLSGPRGTYTMEYYNSNDGSVAGRMGTISGNIFNIDATGASNIMTLSSNGTEALRVTAAADISLPNNLVQGTAGKGVNFTANTAAAGMTSQLLNWYEEGTFTVSQLTSGSQSCRYTRIGRLVAVELNFSSYTLSAATLTTLPFTSAISVALAVYTDGSAPGSGTVLQALVSGTSLYLRTYSQTTGAYADLTDLTGDSLRITGLFSV